METCVPRRRLKMKTIKPSLVISLAKSTIIQSLAPLRTLTSHTAPENRLHCAMEASTASDPSAFLSEIIGVPVTVKLNSGVVYKGISPSEAI
jgi:hypothetical protein